MTRALADVPFSRDQDAAGLDLGNLMAAALVLAGLGAFAATTSLGVLAASTAVVALIVAKLLRAKTTAKDAEPVAPTVVAPAADATLAAPVPSSAANRQGPPTLRRELLAIATLYAVLCVLPLLIGLWLGTA
jgi:hypothetical protein